MYQIIKPAVNDHITVSETHFHLLSLPLRNCEKTFRKSIRKHNSSQMSSAYHILQIGS